ncbi:hypothetical protein AF435_14695 [Listeria monocytogenes]|uniref:Uncharacterized protein n=1 Tax=Listeria monocytogenes TaxID=1639 RepID=A0AAN3BFA0_LISMN|nr:hypothetical protein [Listeria monocytogenes]EAC3367792.1 hypothetical protein [Listeria monocytogenes]EAC7086949.1 hypothetical protein [Listeria monocytogenes]EAC8542047.1 hypothetical protein [Listeria monocytogenes]EAC8548049.1 hypothetical protein [Listeria monocytogenes]
MSLNIDEKALTIMDIKFDTLQEFKGAWYAISSNMYEGYEPTKEDILQLKEYVTTKKGLKNYAEK